MKHCYNEDDATIATIDIQLHKIIARYVAKTLTSLEESEPEQHKQIVKKQFWFLKEDILKLINQ